MKKKYIIISAYALAVLLSLLSIYGTLNDWVVDSLPGARLEYRENHLGWIYKKYSYKDREKVENSLVDNEYFKPVTDVDDVKSYFEEFGKLKMDVYDFDVSIIDDTDYFYIENSDYERARYREEFKFNRYKVYLLDRETMVLYRIREDHPGM